MATQGIKIIDLPTIESIPVEDMDENYFLVTDEQTSRKIKTSSLYQTFSGVNNFNNLGGGVELCKSITPQQVITFNTLSGIDPLKSELVSDVVRVSIKNNSIESSHLKDNAISGTKLQNNSVTPSKLSSFGSNNTFINSSTKIDTQTIQYNTYVPVNGLLVTVTTPSNTSRVLLTGFLSVNCPQGLMNITRFRAGLSQDTVVSDLPPPIPVVKDKKGKVISPSYSYGMFDIGNGDLNNAITIPISYVDSPNFAGQITYKIYVNAVGGTAKKPNNAYINRSSTEDTRSISHLTAIVLP
jgi:hypothetical protein